MIQRVKLRHINTVRAGGSTYYYHRKTGERLPDGEEERALRVLAINRTLDGWRDDVIPGSLGDLICRYKAAPEFKRRAKATRAYYGTYLNLLERSVATTAIADIDVSWLYEVRDAMADTPRAADAVLEVLSVLLSFAIARGMRQDNPVRHVKRLRLGKSYGPWSDEALDRFRAGANPRMVWGLEIALYTGQRLGDVLKMQWGSLDQDLIAVAQAKTGERLHIPVHPDLADILDRIPRVGTNIVHREDGRAYTPGGFSAIFRRELKRLGIAGLVFHGLRATAAARLAEAGATDRELMAILGHRTASMVTRYTRKADQTRLAQAAITKLRPRNFAKDRLGALQKGRDE